MTREIMARPGYINSWRLGEVTGDDARAARRNAKHLRKLSKIDEKIAKAQAKLARLEARRGGLAGWLASWF